MTWLIDFITERPVLFARYVCYIAVAVAAVVGIIIKRRKTKQADKTVCPKGESTMISFCINLNIHYSAPQEVWNKVEKIYTEMQGWKGFENGCPKWYGDDSKRIYASVEPSGLQFYGKLPQEEWTEWLRLFIEKATAALGYPIGQPEDGYEFKIYD